MISISSRNRTLSPRQLAQVLGVSESSVKRWIDAGRVPATRTQGGHRRIELIPALRFLRDSGHELANPGLLGFPPSADSQLQGPTAVVDRFFELLRAGNGQEVARLLLAALVARTAQPAELLDGPVRAATERIGQLSEGGDRGIFIERRATQALLQALDQIDALFAPPSDGPIAVGGAIEGDASPLSTRMAATVLASEGVRPVNLGADVPPAVLLVAAGQVAAGLVWVSVDQVTDVARQSEALQGLVHGLAPRGVDCVLGGREIHRLRLSTGGKARIGGGLADLAAAARQLVLKKRR